MRLKEIVEGGGMKLGEMTVIDAGTQTKDFVVMVGLPGSGKSTLITQMKKEKPYTVISTDDIFEEWGKEHDMDYNAAFKTFEFKDVEREMNNRLRNALNKRKNVIVDRTNMTVKSRARMLHSVPKGYKKIAIVFDVDPTELKRRLDKREKETGKKIPTSVIDNMRQSYQIPSKAEGFDEIKKAS